MNVRQRIIQAGATGQILVKAPGSMPSMSIAPSACPISNDLVIGAPIKDSADLLFGHMAFATGTMEWVGIVGSSVLNRGWGRGKLTLD